MDDPQHGGAYGACAYKTLTYALSHATHQIALQTGVYTPATETFPIVLNGVQALTCKYLTSGSATLRGSTGSTSAAVIFQGTNNALYDCNVDCNTSGVGGVGVQITATGASTATGSGHTISSCDIGKCGGYAIQTFNNINNVAVYTSKMHDSYGGVIFNTPADGCQLVNNSFSNNTGSAGYDIRCGDASAVVTGNGNTNAGTSSGKPTCLSCGNCPF